MPVEHAVNKPIEDLNYVAAMARRLLERVEYSNRFESYRFRALLVVAGFVLGIGVSYLFLARQISDLSDRTEQINQRLLLDVPARRRQMLLRLPGRERGRH